MDEILIFILGLGCILLVIAPIGHGLWLAAAFIIGKLTGDKSPKAQPYQLHQGQFDPSGQAKQGQPASENSLISLKSDLEGTARELQRLRRRNLITQEHYNELLRLVNEDHVRLVKKPLPPSLGTPPASSPATKAASATAKKIPPPQKGEASPFALKEKNPLVHQGVDSEEIVLAEVVESADEQRAAPPLAAISPASRQAAGVHPLDRDYSEQEAAKPSGAVVKKQISRTMSEVLKSFMEDKNIRWVELLSGVLIVVCATGLVISLKSVLEKVIPYFPSLLFMLFTAAIHAAGIYTLRSWKLKTTSRGMLVIGTLLIPLNFLAAVAFSKTGEELRSVTDPVYLLAVVIALLSFSCMMFFTSRALLGEGWLSLLIAVLGPSMAVLIINRQSDPSGTFFFAAAMITLPLASYVGAIGEFLYRANRWRRISLRRAEQTFLLLGLSLFSFLAPVWLMVSNSSDKGLALSRLSPWLSVAGAMVLAIGLLLHHRTLSKRLANIRTTGTALTILGGFLLVMMLALAWPQPELLMAVGAINGALLIGLAIFGRWPVLHAAGMACLALAYLVGFHYFQGAYAEDESGLGRQIVETLLRSESSIALTLFAALMSGVGGLFTRAQRRGDALGYFGGSAALCAVSAAIAAFVGFHPHSSPDQVALATPILGFNALAGFVGGRLILDRRVTWGATGLLLVALVHAFVWNQPLQELLQHFPLAADWKLAGALLCQGLIGMGIAWAAAWRTRLPLDADKAGAVGREFSIPLSYTSLAASVLGAAILLFSFKHAYASIAIYMAAGSLVWLVAALLHRRWEFFSVFQAAATAALIFCCAAYGQTKELLQDNFLDPPHLLLQLGVLAVWCMIWPGLRRVFSALPTAKQIMTTPGASVDQITLYGLAIGLGLASLLACWAGILAEMGDAEAAQYLTTLALTTQTGGAWLTLLLVSAALVLSLWERPSEAGLTCLYAAAAIAALLAAVQMDDVVATASALRWTLAVYTLLAAGVIWARTPISALLDKLGWEKWRELPAWTLRSLIGATFLFGATPVVLLTTWTVVQVSLGVALGGPAAGSFFDKIGPSASFAVPLSVLVAVMLGFAIRQRESLYASAGSVLLQYVVCLAVLLPIFQNGRPLDVTALIELLQWNTLGLAGYALMWLMLRPLMTAAKANDEPSEIWCSPLGVQITFMLFAAAVMTLWAMAGIVAAPQSLPQGIEQFGRWPSYTAMLLSAAVFAWRHRDLLYRQSANLCLGFTFALSAFAAVSCDSFDISHNWLSYHVLTMVWVVISAAASGVACWLAAGVKTTEENKTSPLQAWTIWASVLGALVIFLALRGGLEDPLAPWMTSGPVLIVGLAAAALGFFRGSQLFAYASTLLAMLTASLFFVAKWPVNGIEAVDDFIHLNLLSAALAGIGWLAVEIVLQQRKGTTLQSDFFAPSVHRAIAWFSVCTILLIACCRVFLFSGVLGEPTHGFTPDISSITAILSVIILGPLVFGLLWDRWAKFALPALFLWGGGATLFGVGLLVLNRQEVFFATTLSGAIYFALVCYLWRQGAHLAHWAGLLRAPDPIRHLQRASAWLPAVTMIAASLLCLSALGIVLGYDSRAMRTGAGCVPLAMAFALGSLAQKERRGALQFLSLLSLALAAIYLSWADMHPSIDGTQWIKRLIRLLSVLSMMSFLYGLVLVRLLKPSSAWFTSSRRAAMSVGAGAFLSLVAVLAMEALLFDPVAGIAISSTQVLAAAVMLALLTASLLSLALLPTLDPLALSEKGRMLYVYGAQAAAALTFAHIYLCRPMWFPGFAKDYWPFIVMGISFAGVGISELFQRMGLRVLAEPLQRTGTFLPLLPALGWWIIASETDQSLVLFSVGLLYVLVSFTRKSLASGMAAAVFGNAALWSLLSETEWSITAHPQFWLIPPAISVLGAAQMNRDRLASSQLAALRYLCIIVIYLSSTGEMFITGIGNSVWPPIILMALSVGGAFAGIAFRIRAFLYLGFSFLMLSLVSMVWHASIAIEHTWPWWAFGTVVGITILVVIMLFEKKRDEINHLIQKMQDWEQ